MRSGEGDPTQDQAARKERRLGRLRRQLEEKDRELARLRAELAGDGTGRDVGGIKAENVIWVFCTGRSGSTWLASMMGDLEGHAMWNEPLVGALFGEFYYARAAHKKGGAGILGQRHRSVWLKSIRSIVLDGATARYPEAVGGGYVVIKEPHGSVGAPLLREALPESRVVCLVRDPRDVVASGLDAHREGSWTSEHKRWGGKKPLTEADTDPDSFVKKRAKLYVRDISKANEAYEAHEGPKTLVRYEDLRADALSTMRRLYADLGIAVDEGELARVVREHSWESIPEEEKGEGKFFRKGTSGSWKEDLTPEQAEAVEEIAAPLLQKFYAG